MRMSTNQSFEIEFCLGVYTWSNPREHGVVQVDPSIIGGVVIDIGDKHMDLSISSRIKRIQQMVLDTA